jgi:hypothetical protein
VRRPLYQTNGHFLAEIGFYSPVPFPPNSYLKTLLVEARSRGRVLGRTRYTGSRIVLVGSNVRLGKALVAIQDDMFVAFMRSEAASPKGHGEVEIDVRVNCEFAVSGLSDSGPHDFHAEPQFCAVRDSFSDADLSDVLPGDVI